VNPGVGCPRGKRVGRGPGKSGPHIARGAIPSRLGIVTEPMLPRKASSELARRPYPKPTQVGG
jgi:hypothetical protein